MSILFFRSNHPIYLIFLPIVALLFWLPPYFLDTNFYETTTGIFNVHVDNQGLSLTLGWLFVVVEGFLISQIVNGKDFLKPGSYLPAFVYVLLMSIGNGAIQFSSIHVANLFLIFAYRRSLDLYGGQLIGRIMFDSGLFIGLAAFFHFNAAVLLVGVYIAQLMATRISLRKFLVMLYGIATPWAIMFMWRFVVGLETFDIDFSYFSRTEFTTPNHWFADKWFLGVLGFVTFMAFVHFFSSFQRSTLRLRAEKRIVLALTLAQMAGLAFGGMIPEQQLIIPFLAVPFTIIFSTYFFNAYVKWIADFSFIVFVGVILFVHYRSFM